MIIESWGSGRWLRICNMLLCHSRAIHFRRVSRAKEWHQKSLMWLLSHVHADGLTLMPRLLASMAHSSVTAVDEGDPATATRIHRPNPEERVILNELSDLLAVPHENPAPYPFKVSNPSTISQASAVDRFLSPEEKLRGVFLQKLNGRAAIECALNNVGVDLTADVIAGVLNKGNLGGEAMVTFFKWAIRHPSVSKDADSYDIVIKALGRRKYFEFMEKMLCEMVSNGIKPSLTSLSLVLDSFLRGRHVSKAIEFFGKLGEFGWECNTETLNVLLQCLCQRSHAGAANRFMNSIKGKIPLNVTTYNIIVSGWSKHGSVGEIRRVLEEMAVDGLSPDCNTFSCVIKGFGRAGQIDEAVEIFNGVKDKSSKVGVTVYNAMITNFAAVADFDSCLKYYRDMLSDGCDPNVDTYTNLITAFLKARRVADALEMLDEMLSRELVPSTGAITSFIEPLCSYGPPYAAMMIYKKAKKAGCQISLAAYKLLLMRLSRFGKCGMMLNLWEEMQESGHSSDTEVYEYIINGLCNNGQLDSAALVMDESLQEGFCPSRLIWSKLNNKLMASYQVEKAYKLFLKVKVARQNDNARRYWRANGWHF